MEAPVVPLILNMKCCTFTFLLILNGFLLMVGLILLLLFPNWILQTLIAKLMYLHEDGTGKSSYITDFWERLPAVHVFKFYIFNVTNPNDVMFHGHDPVLEELGPYTYSMTEIKENIKYLENGNLVSFRSIKTWVFDSERSCPTCNCNDEVELPNLIYAALIYYTRTVKINILYRRVLDIIMIAFRVNPIKKVKVCEILLDSYKDPILEFYHNPIIQFFAKALKLTLPDIPEIGYFPHYNQTGDGDFIIKTGKDDIRNIGQIVSWNNYTELPWWNTPEARTLKGSGDGINQRPGIGKNDKYEMFQPLICRKLTLQYSGYEGNVQGVPTIGYSMVKDTFDGVRDLGYRYENLEKVNYFPNWPCGANHTVKITPRCQNISCDTFSNWCDKCCNGSFINNTWVLPPGLFPLRCQPARTYRAPMGLFYSTPHFLWSPKEVRDTVKGLKPNESLHNPGMFQLNSPTGHTIAAQFRIQFNVPINPGWAWRKVPNKIVPTVWVELTVEPKQYALDFLYLATVVSQRVVFIISLISLGASAFLTAFLMYSVICGRSKSKRAESNDSLRKQQSLWL